MKTSLHLLTCAGRETSLAATLDSWARCDWGKETPRVFFNREPGDADCFLLLEDDLAFARHIRAALECWPPLLEKKIGCASFYDPGLPMTGADPAGRCTFADSWGVFGSQARLFTRECAAWLMPLFTLGAEHHDQQTARLVALRWPLYYHAPSLVQHTGRISTWGGGGFHTAGDFVEDWVPG